MTLKGDAGFVYSAAAGVSISSSTNASPIEITTSSAHGLLTGDWAVIEDHQGNAAANGLWKVTKVSATKFTLNGSSGSGSGGATGTSKKGTELALQFPLFRIRPGRRRTRRQEWALDGAARKVIAIGASLQEIVGSLRFAPDPFPLLDMLEAGAEDATLFYLPSLATPLTNYPFKLVSPVGSQLDATRDSARGLRGEYEEDLRLRRVDGGSVEALFP